MRARAPGAHGRLRVVVIGIVVAGDLDGQPGVPVAAVLPVERVRVVFRVAGDEDLRAAVSRDGIDACLVALGEDLEALRREHLLLADRRVPGVRHEEGVVKPAEEDGVFVRHLVAEDAEELLLQRVFFDAVVVVERGLRRPADVERAGDVGLAPGKDLAQLLPVFHLLKLELLHRRARDDQAVEVLLAHLVKRLVEGEHVLLGRVFGDVALHHQQLQLDLQRRVAQQARQLRLRRDLGGHEVEQQQTQRADLLRVGARLMHDEDVLALQHFPRRQVVGNLDGHGRGLLFWKSALSPRAPG